MSNGWEWINREPVTPKADPECGVPYCANAMRENDRGGEARSVVAEAARTLGVELSAEPVDGEIWSTGNMRRIVKAIESLQYELARHRGLHQSFGGSRRGERNAITVAAAHAALTESMDLRG
jgi:hypothetical protein